MAYFSSVIKQLRIHSIDFQEIRWFIPIGFNYCVPIIVGCKIIYFSFICKKQTNVKAIRNCHNYHNYKF